MIAWVQGCFTRVSQWGQASPNQKALEQAISILRAKSEPITHNDLQPLLQTISQESQDSKALGVFRTYIVTLPKDATLVCGEKQFPANSLLLAAQSEVFSAAFLGNFKESNARSFTLVDQQPKVVELLLSFLEKKETAEIDPQNISSLYQLAHYLKITDLTKTCQKYLETHFWENVNQENFSDWWQFCAPYQLKKMQALLVKFAANNTKCSTAPFDAKANRLLKILQDKEADLLLTDKGHLELYTNSSKMASKTVAEIVQEWEIASISVPHGFDTSKIESKKTVTIRPNPTPSPQPKKGPSETETIVWKLIPIVALVVHQAILDKNQFLQPKIWLVSAGLLLSGCYLFGSNRFLKFLLNCFAVFARVYWFFCIFLILAMTKGPVVATWFLLFGVAFLASKLPLPKSNGNYPSSSYPSYTPPYYSPSYTPYTPPYRPYTSFSPPYPTYTPIYRPPTIYSPPFKPYSGRY